MDNKNMIYTQRMCMEEKLTFYHCEEEKEQFLAYKWNIFYHYVLNYTV